MGALYTATITSAGLRVRESRIIADLLLQGVDNETWKAELWEKNTLQMGSLNSVKRISLLLRARLEPLGAQVWQMVKEGDLILATQAVFAGAVKNSRLLGDFLDIVIREQRALFAESLDPKLWSDYIIGCRGRDPEMPNWSQSVIEKLRSSVFSMLAEAGYLSDTRALRFQNVFLDPVLEQALRGRQESYVLRCMKVTQ